MTNETKEPIGGVFCKGAVALGSGCMRCGRCAIALAEQANTLRQRIDTLESELEAVGAGGMQSLRAPGFVALADVLRKLDDTLGSGNVATTALSRHFSTGTSVDQAQVAINSGASSEVQALSAAPEAIAKLRHLYQNMVNGAVRDTASAKRIAEGLLAPAIEALERATPPAEQQAASSAVLKAIREANMQLVRTGDDAFMLVPYKLATAEQQAAPKAAPGEQLTREQIREVFMARGFTIKEGQTDLKQYVYDAAHALLELVAAPQQEAQEPVATLHCDDIGYVWAWVTEVGTRMRFEQPINLYTAPQPAPAPLSESEYKRGYRDGYERRDAEVRGALV